VDQTLYPAEGPPRQHPGRDILGRHNRGVGRMAHSQQGRTIRTTAAGVLSAAGRPPRNSAREAGVALGRPAIPGVTVDPCPARRFLRCMKKMDPRSHVLSLVRRFGTCPSPPCPFAAGGRLRVIRKDPEPSPGWGLYDKPPPLVLGRKRPRPGHRAHARGGQKGPQAPLAPSHKKSQGPRGRSREDG